MDDLKILKGDDILIGEIVIKQYKLKDLIEIGMEKYQKLLLITLLEPIDLFEKDQISEQELEGIEIYDLICELPSLQEWLIEAMNVFCYGEWEYNGLFNQFVSYTFENPLTLDKTNFKELMLTLRTMYCIYKNKSEIEEEKATSQEVLDMLKEFEQVKKKQGKDQPKVTIDSIIESISVKHPTYNLFNIWDLTLYQLMHTYYRIEHIDNFTNVMRSIYAGVMSSKDIKIEEIHWANKASD